MRLLDKSPEIGDSVIIKPHEPDTGFTGWLGWVEAVERYVNTVTYVVNLSLGKPLMAFEADELLVVAGDE